MLGLSELKQRSYTSEKVMQQHLPYPIVGFHKNADILYGQLCLQVLMLFKQ